MDLRNHWLDVYESKHRLFFLLEMLEPFLDPSLTSLKGMIPFGSMSICTENQEHNCALALDVIRTAIRKSAVLPSLEAEWRHGSVAPSVLLQVLDAQMQLPLDVDNCKFSFPDNVEPLLSATLPPLSGVASLRSNNQETDDEKVDVIGMNVLKLVADIERKRDRVVLEILIEAAELDRKYHSLASDVQLSGLYVEGVDDAIVLSQQDIVFADAITLVRQNRALLCNFLVQWLQRVSQGGQHPRHEILMWCLLFLLHSATILLFSNIKYADDSPGTPIEKGKKGKSEALTIYVLATILPDLSFHRNIELLQSTTFWAEFASFGRSTFFHDYICAYQVLLEKCRDLLVATLRFWGIFPLKSSSHSDICNPSISAECKVANTSKKVCHLNVKEVNSFSKELEALISKLNPTLEQCWELHHILPKKLVLTSAECYVYSRCLCLNSEKVSASSGDENLVSSEVADEFPEYWKNSIVALSEMILVLQEKHCWEVASVLLNSLLEVPRCFELDNVIDDICSALKSFSTIARNIYWRLQTDKMISLLLARGIHNICKNEVPPVDLFCAILGHPEAEQRYIALKHLRRLVGHDVDDGRLFLSSTTESVITSPESLISASEWVFCPLVSAIWNNLVLMASSDSSLVLKTHATALLTDLITFAEKCKLQSFLAAADSILKCLTTLSPATCYGPLTQCSLALIASVSLYSSTEDLSLIPDFFWRNIETFGMSRTDRHWTNLEKKACEALCRVKNIEELGKKPRIRETRGGSHGGKKVKDGHGRGRDPRGEGDRGHVPRDEGGQGQHRHRHRDFPDGGGQGQRDPNDNEEIPELPGLPNWGIHVTYLRVPSDEDEDDYTVKWPEAYKSFIKRFRKAVARDTYGGGNIRIMSDKARDELHKVVLYFKNERLWIALFFRIRDLYLIGFKNRNAYFECSEWDYQLFDRLGFTSGYGDLQKYSGSSMLSIGLGMQKLSDLVINLQRFERGRAASKDNDIATGLLISAIMFAEAARFKLVFQHIMEGSRGYSYINSDLKSYINNWSKLSKLIIAAEERPDLIHTINGALQNGSSHGLEFLLSDDQKVATIEDVRSVIEVMSNQRVDDSVNFVLSLQVTE